MNKTKKSDPKKILVRNTELPVPKTKLIIEGKPEKNVKKKIEPQTQKSVYPKFQTPELNSALNIAKKIDKIKKTTSQKKPDVAFCEKVTRKINFPSDQAIYKDLIPLRVSTKSPPILSSREPLPQKDREPVLSDYAKPPTPREYTYQPLIKTDRQQSQPQLNNLRLYKLIQMHNQ